MVTDRQELLLALRAELEFVEKGGYKNPPRAAWRPPFIFEDSPTCLNFDGAQPRKPCSECALMQLVPSECREKRIPCRHIPLNDRGETVDSFYRSGTQLELNEAFIEWLKQAIGKLEREKGRSGDCSKRADRQHTNASSC